MPLPERACDAHTPQATISRHYRHISRVMMSDERRSEGARRVCRALDYKYTHQRLPLCFRIFPHPTSSIIERAFG